MTELLVFVKDKKKALLIETNDFIADLIKRSNLVQCNLDRIIETIEKKLKSVLKKEYISIDSKDYLDQILLSDNLNEKLSSWKIPEIFEKFRNSADELQSKLYNSYSSREYLSTSFRIPHTLWEKPSSYFSLLNSYLEGGNSIDRINMLTYDVERKNIILIPEITYPTCCNIPGNFLFAGGGKINEFELSNKYYLINLDTYQIVKETIHLERTSHTVCAYFNMNVYYFGSEIFFNFDNSCYKYNLVLDTWTQFADFPEKNKPCSSLVYESNILIAGIDFNYVYKYSPLNNSYSVTSKQLGSGFKGLAKHKNQLFLFFENSIYEVDTQFKNLKKFGDFLFYSDFGVFESVETENSIFFRSSVDVFRMNFLTKEVECLVDTSYSKLLCNE